MTVLCLLSTGTDVSAQLNESISVEGRYEPEVVKLDRVNIFPESHDFTLTTSPLDFSEKGVETPFTPFAAPLEVTGWRATRNVSDYKGYLDFGLGSYLKSTLSAGYRFIDRNDMTAGVRLQHNSTSLGHARLEQGKALSPRFRYDEDLGIFASRRFSEKGRLDAAIDYHLGYFNYYGFKPLWEAIPAITSAPTQTLNDLAARVSWHSPAVRDNLSWNAAAGVRYFGFREMYVPFPGNRAALSGEVPADMRLESSEATRETDVRVEGGLNFPLSRGSSIGMDLDASILLYAGEKESRPDNYSLIGLHPYYRFAADALNVRIGAALDFTPGIDTEKFSFFHAAPEIKADYNAGPASLYLHLLGGTRANTLASQYEEDYYCSPQLTCNTPLYSPLDAALGVTFGPYSGFSAGMKIAYRVTRHQPLRGWYMAMLNYSDIPGSGFLPSQYTMQYGEGAEMNLHGFSFGLNAAYDFGRVCRIEGDMTYQPQKQNRGYFNGLDRPRITADAAVTVNPWSTLKFRLSYNYRGVRNIYGEVFDSNEKDLAKAYTVESMRLPDLTLLNAGVSYSFSRTISVWLQADNILGRHDMVLPQQPLQGFALTAGAGFLF